MLFIVITDFNGFQQTRQCLDALEQSLWKDMQLIVVDHGTTDELHRGLDNSPSWVHVVRGKVTDWWAGSCNVGIRYALERGASAVVLLNNDCYVTPTCLGRLWVAHLNHPDAIVAARQKSVRTQIVTAGSARSCLPLGLITIPDNNRRLILNNSLTGLRSVRMITGGRGCLIPARVFAKVGLFDCEVLPHYYADHDFYMRAYQSGVDLLVCDEALVLVDDTRTSSANDLSKMSVIDFYRSLFDIKSHRNLKHTHALIRKHVPFPALAWFGLILMLGRYAMAFTLVKVRCWLFQLLREQR